MMMRQLFYHCATNGIRLTKSQNINIWPYAIKTIKAVSYKVPVQNIFDARNQPVYSTLT
jgi:hypothetical protein